MPIQTCRTIIFEEFNRDHDSLYDILSNTDNPASDKISTKIKDSKLLVHSFSEFMKEFAPTVYEVCREIDGKIRFFYTIDPDEIKDIPESDRVKREISEQSYYKMLSRLYSEKGTRGQSNLQFDDDEILEMLTPKQDVETARDLRRKLEYNLKEYYRAEDRGESTEEFEERISACREKIIDGYSGTQSTLIPILLEDLKTKRKSLEQSRQAVAKSGTSDLPLLNAGKFIIDGNGILRVEASKSKALPAPTETEIEILPAETVKHEHNIGQEIAGVLENDYDEYTSEEGNEFVKSLIVSTYAPTSDLPAVQSLTGAEIDAAIERYDAQIDTLEEIFCRAKENFINQLSKVIESLMGMKIFFDHATAGGGEDSKLPEPVIIANCKASKLLTIESNFKKFIEHRGKNQISERIWFAVLPCVMEKNIKSSAPSEKKSGPFGGLNRKKKTAEVDSTDYTSVNSAIKFLKIMNDARILTVINIRSKAGNTFADLSVDEIREKTERLKAADYPHAVYAYPNFTLTIERPGFRIFKERSDRKISLPGIYIDAAYPAAGLLVASQQHDYLESHGFKGRVNRENVCLRLDFEEADVKKNLLTKFNRESALCWSDELRREISKSMFGFAFCSDEVYDDERKPLKNSYVFCARTLFKNGEHYKPIYQTLMEDYVAQCLNSLLTNKLADVNRFLKKTVEGDWKLQNSRDNLKNNVNLILRPNEEIEVDAVRKKVIIRFIDGASTIDDFDIESETSKE